MYNGKSRLESLVGQVFGNLTVIKRSPIDRHYRTAWICSCNCRHIKCEKELIVTSNELKSGSTKHCRTNRRVTRGARIKHVLEGQKFGSLLVVKEYFIKNRIICECMCENDNNIVYRTQSGLVSGTSISCGCIRKDDFTAEQVIPSYLKQIKRNAKTRKLECNLTPEYLYQLWNSQNGKCAISNLELYLITKSKARKLKRPRTASLDRIDSSKGYIEGNVQWVHKKINYMKWDLTQQEFLNFVKMIYEFHKMGD